MSGASTVVFIWDNIRAFSLGSEYCRVSRTPRTRLKDLQSSSATEHVEIGSAMIRLSINKSESKCHNDLPSVWGVYCRHGGRPSGED